MHPQPLRNRVLASLMHVLSIAITFILPLVVYFMVRKRSEYFAFHAKEGLNLHFTFFPIFLLLTFLGTVWPPASIISYILLMIEGILIVFATVFALRDATFSYPVIRYFKV